MQHSTGPVSTLSCQANIRAEMLRAIGSAARDREVFVADWLAHGAPARITHSTLVDAIFPKLAHDGLEDSCELLAKNEHDFHNCSG